MWLTSICFLFLLSKCGNIKISVIVPVYNTESTVSRSLHSILNQTLRDIEIICIDDGSTDNSLSVLKSFAESDKRVAVIHQENCGVSCAQNNGIAAARGEYITFVHSDDYLFDMSAYEIAFKKATENNIDVVVWGCMDESRKNRPILPSKEERILRGSAAAKFFFPNRRGFVWTKMYKSLLLKNNKLAFDTKLKYGEDNVFNFDLVPFVDSVYHINKIFYVWTHPQTGLDKSHSYADNELLYDGYSRHLKKIVDNTACNYCVTKKDIKKIEGFAWKVYLEQGGNRTNLKEI